MRLRPLKEVVGKSGLFTDGDWVLSNDMSEDGTVRLLQLADIGKGRFLDVSKKFISENKLKEFNGTLIKEGDILISRMSDPIARACLVPNLKQKAIVAVDISIVRVDPDVADPYYVMRICNTDFFRREAEKLGRGTTRIRITRKNLEQIGIPLCDLERQKQISAIVQKSVSVLEKRRETIRLADEFLKSAFLEMFGDPSKQYKCYKNQLGDYLDVLGGFAFKSAEFVEEGIPVIKIGTVNKGYFDSSSFSFMPFGAEIAYQKYIVKPFDLLISLTGTTGKDDYGNACVVSNEYESYLLNQRVGKLLIKSTKLNSLFLYYYLKDHFIKRNLTNVSRGVRQANISNQDIMSIKINLPPIFDQQKFADLVQKVEQLKAKQKQSETELQNLFNSLMQRAFKEELCS